jgi:hypothetical protein
VNRRTVRVERRTPVALPDHRSASPTAHREVTPVNTRTIAIAALVIAVLLLFLLFGR